MDKGKKEREQERLSQFSCPNADSRESAPTGVLLSDQIKYYVDSFKMIDPFEEQNLKAAGYELTIGNEYVLGGEPKELKEDGEIRIPPFNVVVIKTVETINLPRFLIARWNVRVRWAYEGLLWVGGPQVDPGWVGHLFCPLYNLSDKEVVLRSKEPIALMDFVTTTPFNPLKSIKYKRPPKRVLLEEYRAAELKSALYALAVSKLEDFRNRIETIRGNVDEKMGAVQGRIDNFVSITFAVVGLLFAAVALFFGKSDLPNWWDPSVFWVSALAIIIAMFAWLNTRASMQLFRRPWHRILFELVILSILLSSMWGFSRRTHSQVRELTKQVQQLREQVDRLVPVAPTGVTPANQPPKSQSMHRSEPDASKRIDNAPNK